MVNTGSVIIRKSQLQTLCLVVLLLPLPLLYLLHIQMTRDYTYTHELHASSRRSMEAKLSRYNITRSLPPATVRRVLVRNTHRVLSIRTPKTISAYASSRKKCRSRICRGYLGEKDLPHFVYCWRKTHLNKVEPPRSQCHFINGTNRAPTALASFPGSGNTWVRGLLQRATGVCTGAIYCDTTLRVSGYPGESLRSGSTLVVKTHQIDPRWTGVVYPPNTTDSYFKIGSDIPVYDAAILLIRNPFHALVSEWNRLMTVNMSDNHINTVGANLFLYNPKWNEYMYSQAVVWQDTVVGWLINNHNHRVMVVKYEHLKQNVNSEIMMMLDFLGYPYSLTVVTKRLIKSYDEFHRRQSNATSFEHFTPEQTQFVKTVIKNTIRILDSHRLLDMCDIGDYLDH